MNGPLLDSIPAAIAALSPEDLNPPAISRPAEDHDALHALLALQGILAAGDGISTELALQRKGNFEANPVLAGSGLKRNAIKAGGNIGVALIAEKLARKGHGKLAKALPLIIGGAQGAAMINNLRRR